MFFAKPYLKKSRKSAKLLVTLQHKSREAGVYVASRKYSRSVNNILFKKQK